MVRFAILCDRKKTFQDGHVLTVVRGPLTKPTTCVLLYIAQKLSY